MVGNFQVISNPPPPPPPFFFAVKSKKYRTNIFHFKHTIILLVNRKTINFNIPQWLMCHMHWKSVSCMQTYLVLDWCDESLRAPVHRGGQGTNLGAEHLGLCLL